MPASTAGSRLSGLRFTDPQDEPGWRHVVVPADSGQAMPTAPRTLQAEVVGAGTTRELGAWLEETWATSLLVLERGTVVHEWYAAGLAPHTRFLGASMTKSALAHLVGRAVTDAALRLDEQVCDHVPELAGTGYDGVRVVDVLAMTSGVDWVEDHRDPDSLASRLLACFAADGDSRALLGRVGRATVPGTRFAYCTADSQVLDWVRERATGRDFAEDLALLWNDLGCTDDAFVGVDGHGVALAGGALAATSRDWARLAALAVDGCTLAGQRLHDATWVESASRPAYPFVSVGRLPSTITTHAGFGYHCWPMDDRGRRVTADGSRGQFASVDRRTGAVVVKTSQWPYDDFLVDRQARDLSYLGLHALLDTVDNHQQHPKEYSS